MNASEPFLQGQLTILRPLQTEDAPALTKWINDEAVTHYMFYGQKPWSLTQVAEHFQNQIKADANAVFIVEEKANRQPIGFVGLYDIHPTARKAEYRVLLGEREYWSKGYGTEVTQLVTFYGFDRLNLNRIWLGITAENQRGIKAYENAGFKVEGVLRQDIYRNSQYYDSVRMGILREGYYRTLHSDYESRFSENMASQKKSVSQKKEAVSL